MKYKTEEKIKISAEAYASKNAKLIAQKYNLHLSTIYDWISRYQKKKEVNKEHYINIRLTKQEMDRLHKLKESYFFINLSDFIIKKIFDEKIPVYNPLEVLKIISRMQADLNKIGSNINQLANYSNYLAKNKYISDIDIINLKSSLIDFDRLKKEMATELKKFINKGF